MQIPDHDSVAETLHGFGIGHQRAEIHHVIVPTGERGCDHDITARQHTQVIAVAIRIVAALDRTLQVIVRRHPVCSHVFAGVGVFDQSGAPSVIGTVGQSGQHHPARQGVVGVWPDDAAAFRDEVVDRPYQRRFTRIAVNIEDEDLAGIQSRSPQVTTIVGEPRMMCLVATADRQLVDDLTVGLGIRAYVDRDELVLFVAEPLDPESPDIDEILLADYLRHVG